MVVVVVVVVVVMVVMLLLLLLLPPVLGRACDGSSVLRRRRLYPFLAVPRRRDGIVAALRLPLPRDGFDLLSRDDPAPGVIDALRAAGHLLHKVRDAA